MSKLNEVEIYFELVKRLLEKKINEKPSGGMKISDECKMKYQEILKVHTNVRRMMLDQGQIRNYDICKNCGNFTQDSDVDYSGLCTCMTRDIRPRVNTYHTCFRNTATRWKGKHFDYPDYPSEENKKI